MRDTLRPSCRESENLPFAFAAGTAGGISDESERARDVTAWPAASDWFAERLWRGDRRRPLGAGSDDTRGTGGSSAARDFGDGLDDDVVDSLPRRCQS